MKARRPTANQSGEAIKVTTQTCKVLKTVYQKYIKASLKSTNRRSGNAVVKLLACEQVVQGWIPSLVATIDLRDLLSLASKSRYGWNIA